MTEKDAMLPDKRSLSQIENLRKQADALSDLSRFALKTHPSDQLFRRVFDLLTDVLQIDHVGIFKTIPETDKLLLIAGSGWNQDILSEWEPAQFGYTLFPMTHIITEDFRQESRFQFPDLLEKHNILSGITVIIPGSEIPFGILGIYANEPRTYSDDEVTFATTVSNILASVLERTSLAESSSEVETQYQTLTRLLTDYAYMAHIDQDGQLVVDWSTRDVGELKLVIDKVNSGGWEQVIHPDDHHIYQERLASLSRMESGIAEFRIITREGHTRWIRAYSYPIQSLTDGMMHLYGAWLDITKTRLAEIDRQESDIRLNVMLNSIVDGIIAIDMDERITFINQSALEMTGWDAHAALGKDLREVFRVVTHKTRQAIDFHQYINRKEFLNHTLLINRQNLELAISWRIAKIEIEDNHSIGMVISFHDVTEMLAIQEKVRFNEELFRTALKGSPVVVFSQNTDLEYTWIYNPKLAYAGRNVLGKRDTDMMERIEDAQYIEALKRQVIETGVGIRREVVTHNEKPHFFDLTIEPLHDKEGRIEGIIAAATDITSLKEAESEVRRLNAKLEQRVEERTKDLTYVNQELEAFSYSVSHDLRTPLRAINGFSQALVEDYGNLLDEEGRFFLDRIRGATQEMSALIDDLLRLSHVTRDTIQIEKLDLSRMAHQIIKRYRAKQPTRQVDVQIADDISAFGDYDLFNILLDNFLNNAWKFTQNTPDPRIKFFTRQEGDRLVYVVSDNGAGFDMAYVDKLFKPFQRLHLKEEFEGTGVGLATIKRIIRRHHGHVWAEGAVGEGATFCFTLPNAEEKI